MPIEAAQSYVASLLVAQAPPGVCGLAGPIDAQITPLDPDVKPDGIARIYVWPAAGPEKRRAFPRNSGRGTPAGWKEIKHDLQVFLTWIDPQPDVVAGTDDNFPLLIDWIMDTLRTSPNEAQWLDPNTGMVSHFENLGENMTYDYPPPRSLESQTIRRYDARIRCSLLELFQR